MGNVFNNCFTSRYEPGVMAVNVIFWHDGTVRPWRNHNNCTGRWVYDGQFHIHKCSQLASPKQRKES